MITEVSEEKLQKYFAVTQEALQEAKQAPVTDNHAFTEIIEMVENYVSDAKHFAENDDRVLAFAALNYAHGWLDCGARLKIFEVTNNRLFTVDGD